MKDKVLIKNSTLDDIGRAIIDKGGSEGPLYPQNMPSAIRSIAGGATTISWDKVTGKPSTFPPSAHKDTHKTGGSDALSPADIGAATEASVASLAASKQDKINDLNDIRSKANAGASHAGSTGNPHATEFAALNNVPTEFTPSAHTHPASQVTDLATVATSGSYNDLSNKPSIPVLENNVTESGANGVKSSGIWSWVKSLLPTWLNKNYVEPATVASVTALAASKRDKTDMAVYSIVISPWSDGTREYAYDEEYGEWAYNGGYPTLSFSTSTNRWIYHISSGTAGRYAAVYGSGHELSLTFTKDGYPDVTLTRSSERTVGPATSDTIAKTSEIKTKTSELTNDSGFVTSSDLAGKQDKSNLVTSLVSPLDTTYPSSKAVSDAISAKQDKPASGQANGKFLKASSSTAVEWADPPEPSMYVKTMAVSDGTRIMRWKLQDDAIHQVDLGIVSDSLVTEFSDPTSNLNVPSEKLVKDSLDAKQDSLAWVSGKHYVVGNVVLKDGKLYECFGEHTSSTTFDTDKWSQYLPLSGGTLKGDLNASWRSILLDDAKLYGDNGGIFYKSHSSGHHFMSDGSDGTPDVDSVLYPDGTYVSTMMKALPSGASSWSSSETYTAGQACWHASSLWIAKQTSTNKEPANGSFWLKVENVADLLSTGNTTLKNTITSTVPATAMRVSTGDPELYELRTGAADPWDAKLDTLSMASPWTTAVEYNMGDFVTYQGKAYQASTHTTSSDVPGVSSAWRQANLPNLFTSANTSLVAVCREYGGTQIKQDKNGNFYYEVEVED